MKNNNRPKSCNTAGTQYQAFPGNAGHQSIAQELGADWSLKKISLLEQKETMEADILVRESRNSKYLS